MEIQFEGSTLVLADKTVQEKSLSPGDIYFAVRNNKRILTCKKMSPCGTFIIPEENAYCFNSHECREVLDII